MSDADDHSSEQLWDDGIKAAFGGEKSVLGRIEARGENAPRIVLRDVPGEATAVIKPGGSASGGPSSRYQIAGEIARGGVGVILKGRDVDLGRDVAMKVLLERHAGNPELVQRFVEEAQVGGQLQHPGIVPVYELGLQPDGRPYFAMKLIKGQTLSAILAKRADPAKQRRKYLSIFEQICHTMAYAHARGVIHRDLKPSNVMVGAFGEVMVVDWGFAKVLSQGGVADEERTHVGKSIIATERSGAGSESIAGSVLGTPAYMPPEQARGERDHLDERADVFSLGAILCEILTGKPAYADGNVLELAISANLQPAYDRLDACSADAELIDLAKRCLAASPHDRPRHANELAEAIGNHLTSVEERAQDARVEAAEALVREQEQRRAKKLTLALAATILIAVVFGGGAFYWQDQRERGRQEAAAAKVAAALVDAGEHLGAARSAEESDLSRWPAALAAAERAVEIAGASGADAEMRARAGAFLADVRAAQELAQTVAASLERDRAAVRRLTAVRLMRGGDFDRKAVDAAFAKAFADFGIEVDELTADQLVARVQESRIADEFFGALEGWSHIRDPEDVEGLTRLREAVRRLDPDPWRTRLRLLDEAGKASKIHQLAQNNLEERSARDLLVLASALLRSGSTPQAYAALSWAVVKNRQDFWTLAEFGMLKCSVTRPIWSAVEKTLRAALELRPDAFGVRYHLGKALQTSDVEGAIAHWKQVYRAEPDYGKVKMLLVAVLNARIRDLASKKRFDAMERSARLMIELAPDDFRAQGDLGLALMRQVQAEGPKTSRPLTPDQVRRLDEAIALLKRATAEQESRYRVGLADALGLRRQWVRALEAARELTRDKKPGMRESGWNRIASTLMGNGDLEGALRAYEQVLAVGHRCPVARRAQQRQDWLLRRMGRTNEALRRAKARIAVVPGDILAYTYAGGCLIELGRVEEAEKLLDQPRLTRYFEVLNLVGVCRALLGDLEQAKKHWGALLSSIDRGIGAQKARGEAIAELQARLAGYAQAACAYLQRPEGWEAYVYLARELSERSPEATEYWAMEIRALYRLGRIEEGLSRALERVEQDPHSNYWHVHVLALLHKSTRIDAYAEEFGKRVADKQDDALAWLLFGHARFAQKRFDDAIAAYERVIQLKPKLFTPHEFISVVHLARRDPAAGLAANRRAAKANPHVRATWLNVGARLVELRRYEEARDPLDRALKSSVQKLANFALAYRGVAEFGFNGPEAGLAYAKDRFLVRPYGTGWEPGFMYALLQQKMFHAAIRCFEYLRKQRPDSALVRGWFAWTLTFCAEGQGWDPERAVRLSRDAVEAMPDSHLLWAFYGFALSRAGAHETSLEAFEKHAKLSGGGRLRFKRWRKAMSLWHQGRKQEARRELERADREAQEQEYDVAGIGAASAGKVGWQGAFETLYNEAHALIK